VATLNVGGCSADDVGVAAALATVLGDGSDDEPDELTDGPAAHAASQPATMAGASLDLDRLMIPTILED